MAVTLLQIYIIIVSNNVVKWAIHLVIVDGIFLIFPQVACVGIYRCIYSFTQA